ncbi:MAG: hypothetical protein V4671_31685 [Armatimonadota bacterium]
MAEPGRDPVDKTWTQALLNADYNQALPTALTTLPTTATATVIDLEEKPGIAAAASAGSAGTASDRGLTFSGNAIEMDSDGTVHLRFRGWLGREPENYSLTGISLGITPEGSPYPGDRYAQDERGRLFLSVDRPLGMSGHSDWYFVPLKPLKVGEPLPETLSLWVTARAESLEYIPELRSNRGVDVVAAKLNITVPLPRVARDTTYDSAPARKGLDYRGHRASLAEEAAAARASYYFAGGLHSINPQDPRRIASTSEGALALLDQAVRWYEAAAVEAEKDRPDGLRWARSWRQNAQNAKRRRDQL